VEKSSISCTDHRQQTHGLAQEDEPQMILVDRRIVIASALAVPLAACKRAPAPEPKPKMRPSLDPRALVELIALDPTVKLDVRYATANNFTGRVLYPEARAFLVGAAAEALLRAHKAAQAEGFGLTIFDAYRPWHITKKLWEATPKAKRNYVANPMQGSRHNRGCAVDLSLHDLRTGALVEMPSGFDDFSRRAHRDFMDAPPDAIANRERLARYMKAQGFRGMSNEWWHFDFVGWENFPVLDTAFDDIVRAKEHR
jgi:zinc D-Ala-D-Ala dipeptidase